MSALLALVLLGAATTGEEAPVAVLTHAIARGDRIEASDLTIEERGAAAARGAMSIEEAAGMEATRNLTAGAIVRRTDLVTPRLVRRGEPVTIRIVKGPLAIAASGRALSSAGQGESVRVVTDATSRTLDGTVESAGTVRIMAP